MKTAFITGATSGIGLAFAKLLAKQGYSLILHGRNQSKLDELEKSLPNVARTITADLADNQQLDHLFTELKSYQKTIDVAINNAGFGLYGRQLELSIDEVEGMLAVNISALTRLSHYFVSTMTEVGSGHILNVASTAAYQPQPYFAAYAASKAYVASFTEALAVETKNSGVKLTCLSPGRTNTGFFTFDGVDTSKDSSGTFDLKHRADPDKIAQLGLKAMFKGQLREIPTLENKVYVFLNRLLPRSVILGMYEKAMINI
ncbi:SDR family oxidoreductase [Vibrio sp. 10N.261.55.A7]|uniref:SDR family NAD(P)-dependent oxidoreductase n=1 Tax=Vibrio TaxID=662 RepID=UPI000C83C635|nr:SDR family oxidoreductase [Vibrio sp. 10N.261.55.A7]PMJ99510.1 SDR family oxidoreductase [Vibrio sp. 10N.261.55.A7]